MNCIECNKPLPEDAPANAIRHPECCGGMWRCHICGHSWRPEITHLSTYGYFFAHCPKCQTKVEEPVEEWYHKIHVSTAALSWLAIGSCLLIGPSMILFPERNWVTISLFIILVLSIIGFIVKGIRAYRAGTL